MSGTPLLSIRHLLQEYRAGHRTPAAVLADIRERAARQVPEREDATPIRRRSCHSHCRR